MTVAQARAGREVAPRAPIRKYDRAGFIEREHGHGQPVERLRETVEQACCVPVDVSSSRWLALGAESRSPATHAGLPSQGDLIEIRSHERGRLSIACPVGSRENAPKT